MKRTRIISIILAVVFALSLTSCKKVEKANGSTLQEKMDELYKDVKVPDIKSEDDVMSAFFNISLYNEENYSEIYLGKDYKYKFIYAGSEINLPMKLGDIYNLGWNIKKTQEDYSANTKINAGKSLKVTFVNEHGKQLIGQFFNSSKSSVELKNCKIVKIIIPENNYSKTDSVYGQFYINGVSNESGITDVLECLGAPSHFYAQSENNYYLDFFLQESDKRSKIRVYVDVASDTVTGIEVSKY